MFNRSINDSFAPSLNAGESFVPCNSTLISFGDMQRNPTWICFYSQEILWLSHKKYKIRYVLFSRVKQYRVQLKIRIKTSRSFSQKEYARITFGLNFMSFCVLRSYIKSITWKWVLFKIKTRPTVRFFSCGLSLNVFFRFDLYEER